MPDCDRQTLAYETPHRQERPPAVGAGVAILIGFVGMLAVWFGVQYIASYYRHRLANAGDFGLGVVVIVIGAALVLGSAFLLRLDRKRGRPGG